jgi:hypothetical protein
MGWIIARSLGTEGRLCCLREGQLCSLNGRRRGWTSNCHLIAHSKFSLLPLLVIIILRDALHSAVFVRQHCHQRCQQHLSRNCCHPGGHWTAFTIIGDDAKGHIRQQMMTSPSTMTTTETMDPHTCSRPAPISVAYPPNYLTLH